MQRTPAMRVLVPALLVAISALSGCGKSEAPPPAQTPEVGIVTLEAQTVTLNTELPGRTNAFRIAEVRPQVNGIILKRLFKEGSDVKAGQQLYQIDPAPTRPTTRAPRPTWLRPRSRPSATSCWSPTRP